MTNKENTCISSRIDLKTNTLAEFIENKEKSQSG